MRMNQTTWIVGGGIILLAIAGFLFMFTGDSGTAIKKDTPTVENKTLTMPPTTPSIYKEATIKTNQGDIVIKFYGADAPKTVDNFAKLAKDGFYSGIKFHRVIKGFMIQAGDPQSKDDSLKARWGSGGPGYQFDDEINASSQLYTTGYKRGIVAMANAGANTNGSQFFIMHQDYALPPKYTIFGEVLSGLEVVDKIANTKTGANDQPVEPMVINSVEIR
jgi:cyclophilin family peptidyl-prolyl cis-trans isomerase